MGSKNRKPRIKVVESKSVSISFHSGRIDDLEFRYVPEDNCFEVTVDGCEVSYSPSQFKAIIEAQIEVFKSCNRKDRFSLVEKWIKRMKGDSSTGLI